MSASKGASSPIQLILGAVLTVVGIVLFFSTSSYPPLLLVALGALLFWHGYEWGKLRRVKRVFDAATSRGGSINLQAMASQLDMEVPELKDALEELTRRGMAPKMAFTRAGEKSKTGAARVSGRTPGVQGVAASEGEPDWVFYEEEQDPKPQTVRCSSCGATVTVVPGYVTECDHCGTKVAL